MKPHLLIFLIALSVFYSCGERLPVGKKISGTNYSFTNQDSLSVKLDSVIQNKVTLFGFIYTHCPDICPMTTHNLYLTWKKLVENNITEVQFILVTFDPERDTPSTLKNFGRVRDIDFGDWNLLTGDTKTVNQFNRMMGIKAIPDDSTYNDDGELSYYVIHTDRITLVDKQGRIRAEYKGSTVDPQIIFEDVKYLGE